MAATKNSSRETHGAPPGTLGNQGGYALAVVIILALVSAVVVAAFLSMTLTENRIVHSNNDSMTVFFIAEAGLEKGARLLYEDMVNTPEGTAPSWRDQAFYFDSDNPADGGYTTDSYITYFPTFRAFHGPVAYAGGTYTVEIANIEGRDDAVWLRATGTFAGKSRAVMSEYRIKNLNPWNNAIFAGAGGAGRSINGCVDIRGSVHILGESDYHDVVMEMSGSAYIGNNYVGMPWDLSSRVPSIAEDMGGTLYETLDAEVRVRYGQVSISGSADIGLEGETTEIIVDAQVGEAKLPVDGTYVTDGWTGNKGASAVHSDNGTEEPYDLPEDTFDGFPRITDPYEGYPSYVEWYRANALVISDSAALANLAAVDRGSSFSYSDEHGSIAADGHGNLAVSGMVLIDGDFGFARDNSGPVYYTGKASILATGNITYENDVFVGSGQTFPTSSILGLMTPGTITFTTSQLDTQGIFYAETQITSTKQTDVSGTFFANYFDMGNQVPAIFQVPSVIYNLPPGMFGSVNIFSIRRDCFREVEVGGTE